MVILIHLCRKRSSQFLTVFLHFLQRPREYIIRNSMRKQHCWPHATSAHELATSAHEIARFLESVKQIFIISKIAVKKFVFISKIADPCVGAISDHYLKQVLVEKMLCVARVLSKVYWCEDYEIFELIEDGFNLVGHVRGSGVFQA